MLRRCLRVLLLAPLLVLPAHAEEIAVTVCADAPTGVLPTWFEPSAFFGWTSTPMRLDFAADAGRSGGLIVESTHQILGPPTSLADYRTRGLALGAASAGAPPVASIAFGTPTAPPGQCGVTSFAACRTTPNGATMRCP